jgi:Rad51 protein
MGTRQSAEPLQPKIWQIDQAQTNLQGYLYSCSLCEETLVLSKLFVNPRRVQLVFQNTCPGCGFELEKTLKIDLSTVPGGRRLFTNQACRDADQLAEPGESFERGLSRGSALLRDVKSDLTSGLQLLDKTLVLRFGQLVGLQGDPSNALSHLFCVRAVYPLPPGLDSDVVFVDGGNVFNAYSISQHASDLAMDQDVTKERVHLSRAFTHHQLSGFINEKLERAVEESEAKLAIVSDMTALYCDPDVKEKKEALDLFRKDVRYLADLAEQLKMIIIVSNHQSRSKAMDSGLERTAHVSATLKDKGAYTQLTVTRHPFMRETSAEVITLDNLTLTKYL